MRDYWLTQYLLGAIGWGYLIVVLIVLILVLWLIKGKNARTVIALIVLAPALILLIQGYQEYVNEKQAAGAYRTRLAKARAFFDERCKTAGEKIYGAVDGVDGVFLITIKKEANKSAQYEMNDPAGDDAHDIGYVESFFMGKQNDFLLTDKNKTGTYRFVEALSADAQVTRYTDDRKLPGKESLHQLPLTKQVIPKRKAKYGVLTEDLSTTADRENWISASHIKVIDLETKEVIAERVGYMFDQALGNTSGGRSPWAFAAYNACPAFPKLHGQYPHKWGLTRNFVEKALKPVGGSKE